MNENPYVSPKTAGVPRKTRGIGWAIWSGVACLVVAAICGLLTVVLMISSFRTIAQTNSTPKPTDLAEGISNAMLPLYGIVPFGLLGIVLVIVGLVVRRPIKQ